MRRVVCAAAVVALSMATAAAARPACAEAPAPVAVLVSARAPALAAVTADGRLAWRTALDARPLGVATIGARVVASLPDGLAAFDAGTGTLLWRLPLEGRPTAPATAGGLAVVGTSAARLVAVAPDTGVVVWTVDAGGPITGAPSSIGDLVLAATRQRDVLAVTADGRLRWRISISGRVTARTAILPGVVYIAALDGRLTGLDLETGRARVVAPLPRSVDDGLVAQRDAAGRDLVAVLLEDGTLAGLTLAADPGPEPRVAWTVGLGRDAPEPAWGDGRLYVGGRDLVALDAATGRVAWRLSETLGRSFGRDLVRRLVDRDRGLSPEEIRAARAASPYELRGAIVRSPVVALGLVLAATDEGFLYAVDAATGELRWRVAEGD